jgi:hypothetical protein
MARLIGYILTPDEHKALVSKLSHYPYREINDVMKLLSSLPALQDNPEDEKKDEVSVDEDQPTA